MMLMKFKFTARDCYHNDVTAELNLHEDHRITAMESLQISYMFTLSSMVDYQDPEQLTKDLFWFMMDNNLERYFMVSGCGTMWNIPK